ncbi:MAG: hypothetical protein RIQ52_794 [Pseudomonadota bacterium]|jgi:intracellular septation protein
MKLLLDFFPILLFFVTYKYLGIYPATAVVIAATVIQVGIGWWRLRRLEAMPLVTLVLIVVFGGATLVFQDEMFIKWKPSVLNTLFAVAFLASRWIGEKPLIQRMMGEQIALPAAIWRKLNDAWTLFFLLLAGVNLYVVYNFDTETWVNFKLFGLLGLTLVFVVVQSFFISRHVSETR